MPIPSLISPCVAYHGRISCRIAVMSAAEVEGPDASQGQLRELSAIRAQLAMGSLDGAEGLLQTILLGIRWVGPGFVQSSAGEGITVIDECGHGVHAG
jgi:hypothetical protein